MLFRSPGESLPRWAFGLYWRKDGEPVWRDPALIADENHDYGVSAESAQKFLQTLAERLGLDARHVFPGFEDVFYYLWRERRLPINVDPFDSRLEDAQERLPGVATGPERFLELRRRFRHLQLRDEPLDVGEVRIGWLGQSVQPPQQRTTHQKTARAHGSTLVQSRPCAPPRRCGPG